MRTWIGSWLLGLAILWPGLGGSSAAAESDRVLLATTTSVRDSGLLGALLPVFEAKTGIGVRVLAVGSGAALRMGAEGNADLLLTHAPDGEKALLASGVVLDRTPFMENDFVIAGPAEDPASVADAANAVEAFRHIRAAGAAYVSRADDSGTHRRERALFAQAGIGPDERWPGLARTGAGMGLTLQVAGERRAYVLSDLGTFLAFRKRVGLVSLSRSEPALRNVYSVLRVNPKRFQGRIHAEAADALARFLLSDEARERIAKYGVNVFGQPLFRPLTVGRPDD
ncbi:MAG: substrate-binding domain-containing protein [Myxococcota bacterium]